MHALRMGTSEAVLPESFRDAPQLTRPEPAPLAEPDAALRTLLALPTAGPPLERFLEGKRRITVVLPDATRLMPQSPVETLLDALGDRHFSVRIANGTHRRSTPEEQARILGRHFSRVPHGDRHADDPFAHRALPLPHERGLPATGGARLSLGHPRLDVQAAACDALVLAGPVSFHYLAGFGGGGKLLAPGVADRATAERVHSACLAKEGGRHPRAITGVFDDNPLQARIEEICESAPPQFYVQTVLDSSGLPVGLFAGERRASHAAARAQLLSSYAVPIEKRPVVIVGGGGHPYDLDFVQAHKALEAAASACTPGGTIVFVAACTEGLPARHRAFLERHPDAAAMERTLRERFDIAGHTVWAARLKAERFHIRAVTAMDDATVRALGMTPFASLHDALADLRPVDTLVLPFGARFLPVQAADV